MYGEGAEVQSWAAPEPSVSSHFLAVPQATPRKPGLHSQHSSLRQPLASSHCAEVFVLALYLLPDAAAASVQEKSASAPSVLPHVFRMHAVAGVVPEPVLGR